MPKILPRIAQDRARGSLILAQGSAAAAQQHSAQGSGDQGSGDQIRQDRAGSRAGSRAAQRAGDCKQ